MTYDANEGHDCKGGLTTRSVTSSSIFVDEGIKTYPYLGVGGSSTTSSKPKPPLCTLKLESLSEEHVIGDSIKIRATIVAKFSIILLNLSIDLPKGVNLQRVIPKNHNVSLKARQKFVVTFTLRPPGIGNYRIGPLRVKAEAKKSKETRSVTSSSIHVDVLPNAPQLVIRPELPEYFPVLERTNLKLQVFNAGRGKASDITIQFKCPRGISHEEVGIIRLLKPNESRTVVIEIYPTTSTREGNNKIRISTKCTYAEKRVLEFPEDITIQVRTEPPELKLHYKSLKDSEGTVHLRLWVHNIGTGLAKDVRIKVDIPDEVALVAGGTLIHTEDEVKSNERSTTMDLWLEPTNPSFKTIKIEDITVKYKNAKGRKLPQIIVHPRAFRVLPITRRRKSPIDPKGPLLGPIPPSLGLLDIERTEDTNPATKETTVFVRLKNTSKLIVTSGSIQITKYPEDVLKLISDPVQKFSELEPGKGLRGIPFVFAWKDVWCIEGTIFATITYFDHTQRTYVKDMRPLSFRHVCIILEPSQITQSRFEELLTNLECQLTGTHIRGIKPSVLFDRFQNLALLKNFQVVNSSTTVESNVFSGTLDLAAIHRSLGTSVFVRLRVRGVEGGRTAVVTMDSYPKENTLAITDEIVNTLCDRFKIIVQTEIGELRKYLESEFGELKVAMAKVGISEETQLAISDTLHQLRDRTDELANSYRGTIERFELAADKLESNLDDQTESFERLVKAIENLQEIADVPKTRREKAIKLLRGGFKEGLKEALKIAIRLMLPIPI
jgi:hypothetical protein